MIPFDLPMCAYYMTRSHRLDLLLDEVSPEEAKKAAQKILSNPRYRPRESTPRPLSWLGRIEQRIFSAIGRFFERIVPGSGVVQWFVIALLVAVLAWALARFLSRRTKRRRPVDATLPSVSVDTIDAEAQAALERGDYRESVILRFRAGIVRLERGPRPAASRRTNGSLGSTIPVTFPSVGVRFDAVRYGDQTVDRETADAAASEWPKILNEAGSHAEQSTDQLAPRSKKRFRRQR